jgi:hypothetical protein
MAHDSESENRMQNDRSIEQRLETLENGESGTGGTGD